MNTVTDGYKYLDRFVHLGLAAFGLAAYLSAEGAEHHEGGAGFGYLLHAYLGMAVGLFVVLRLLRGIAGPAGMRFGDWLPAGPAQWRLIVEDLRSIATFRMPERQSHEGLAGLVQAFGLALFAWMAATGVGIYALDLLGAGGSPYETVEELHEVGETLIPLFLAMHVGAVVLHSIAGRPVWPRMFSLGPERSGTPPA